MPQKSPKSRSTLRLRPKRIAFEQLERREMFAVISGQTGVHPSTTPMVSTICLEREPNWLEASSAPLWKHAKRHRQFQLFQCGAARYISDDHPCQSNSTGLGANADPTQHLDGKPTAGTCNIGRGNHTVGDPRGDGDGWFLDPTLKNIPSS